MGNENSSAGLPEGATNNVVLFPPQETESDSTHKTEVHSEKISPEGEKSTSAENEVVQTEVQSPFHSLSPVAEEDTQTHEDGSRKEEELEFPHDLLPSIDLSTELNLTWGASFRDVKGKTHEHEKGCSSEACPLEKKEVEEEENVFFIGSEAGTHTVVRGKSHFLSSTGTKGIKTEEESALEEASASALDFTPPLMTSTMPEMRECEGVGEKGTGDLERVKMTEKGYLDEPTELQETNKSLCSDGKPNKIIAAEVHSFSLSFPQTNNSPAKDAKEAEAASEVRWSSRMLQNSEENEENEEKGGGLLVDCSLGMDSLSAAGEKETGTASVRDMTVVAASTPEFNDRCDWKRKSSESLEKGGEGGTEEGRGKKRGGAETLYREQALSLTEAKSYPLHDNGLKLVPPQQKDELVTLTTADIANTALPLLTNNKTTASSLYNPSSPDFLPNSTDTESEEASEKKDRKNKSLNALGEKQPDSNNLHWTAASANLTAQTSYQQVQNTSLTQTEISSTQQNKAGTAKDTSYKTENQHLSSTSQLDKWSTASFNKVDKGTRESQEDMPRQVTGFASLPPLTFHENLWHPVSESSFNFQGLFGNRKPDPPQKTAYTTCESTSVAKVREENMTVNENPEKQIDVKKIHDLKDKTANNLAMSAEELLKNVRTNDPDKTQEKEETLIFTRSTLEHKPSLEDTNENGVKLQDNVLEEIGSDKVIGLSDLVLSNEDRNSAVVLTTKEVNEKEDKLGESDVRGICQDHFQNNLSDSVQESKLESQASEGVSQECCIKSTEQLISCTGDGMMSSHSTDGTGISKNDTKPNTEQPFVISVGCPQAKFEEHMSELQYQTDSSRDIGSASEVSMGVVSTKDPSPTAIKVFSALEGSAPSARAHIQSDTKVPVGLRAPGPMMSHWEVINDYNVSLPGEEMQSRQDVKGEMSSKMLVKTVTVGKPELVETTEENTGNNLSLSCTNVLIPDITVMASTMQNTKLSCKEVKCTGLTYGSLHVDENTNEGMDFLLLENSEDGKSEVDVKPGATEKPFSTGQEKKPLCMPSASECSNADSMLLSQSNNSTKISHQIQISNNVISEEGFQAKPKEDTSKLKFQTDLCQESQAVSIVLSTKDLTPVEIDLSGMGEGGVSSSSIQSDPKLPIVLSSGPMMSQWEVSNDCKVSVLEKETHCNYNKIGSLGNGNVIAADIKNKTVKTDTVEKPDEHSESVEIKKEKSENDKSSSNINILIQVRLPDEASSKQDIELDSTEVNGSNLTPDSLHNEENFNKITFSPSAISTAISQQTQRTNTVILEECFQTRPEENMRKLQYQKDTVHDSEAVLDIATVSTKDHAPPDFAGFGLRDREVSFAETPNEHSEPAKTKKEKNENDNNSSCMDLLTTVIDSSVQGTKLAHREVEGKNLAPASECSKEKGNPEINFVVQDYPGVEKLEEDGLTRQQERQLNTHPEREQITKDINEAGTVQETEQNIETLLLMPQQCIESKLPDKCDVISKPNVSTPEKVCVSSEYVSAESEDRMANLQSSPSAHTKSNSLMEIDTSNDTEYCAIECSIVIPQRLCPKPAVSEMNPVLTQVPIEDTVSFNKDNTVGTNKTNKEDAEVIQVIKQPEEPKCANDFSAFKKQTLADKLNLPENTCEQSISNVRTMEGGLSGKHKEELNTNKKTTDSDELQENNQNVENKLENVQITVEQKFIKEDQKESSEKKQDIKEAKHLHKTAPGTSLLTCLSESDLILTGFVKEVQNCGTDLIEATQPSTDQDLVQVTCCEKDQTQHQTVVSELDLAPGLNIKSQPTELQQPQECIEAAELMEIRGLQRYDDVFIKEPKVSCSSYEEQASGILENRIELEDLCSSSGKLEKVTLLMDHDNIITEGDVCLDEKQNQNEPSIKPTGFEDVSSLIKVLNEKSTEDWNQANQIKLDSQENEFLGSSVDAFENKELNTELKKFPESVIQALEEKEGKPHSLHTSESQVSVDKPEEVLPDLGKADKLANDLSKPCEELSTSYHQYRIEDQCSSAITFDKTECTEVCSSVLVEAIQPSSYKTPIEKMDSETVADVFQDKDNVGTNEAQIHKIELPSTPLQAESLALEMEQHIEASMDLKHSQNKECQDAMDPKAHYAESQGLTTSAGTEEEAKNKTTQTAISEEVKQMAHRKEEISGGNEDGRENETAEGRKLTEKSEGPETRAVKCDLKDIIEGNERKLPEHKEENSNSFLVKTVRGDTDVLKSSISDGLQSEQEKVLSSSPRLTAVVMVSCLQETSQTLLDASTDSNPEAANSFIQTMHENASTVLKTEHGSKCGELDSTLFSNVAQKEKVNSNENIEKESTDEESSVTLKTSVLSEEDVSDSPGAAVSPVIELKTLSTEESCESSDWLRALKEASISLTQQNYKLETPCGSADNRPFETLDKPQAEQESYSLTKDSVIKEQPVEPAESRPLLSESADGSESAFSFPPPPEEDTLLPALPAHLFCDSTEFPTPPPTPPESAPLEPEPEFEPRVSTCEPDQCQNAAVALIPQLLHDQQSSPLARSSDSDGTFETPESTTPVKTAAPPIPSVEQPEPITQPLTSIDTDSCPLPVSTVDDCASEVLHTSSSFHSPSRSDSTFFDEDKPIASSGTYNLDHVLKSEPFSPPAFDSASSGLESRTPLTRSLSFQSGEIDSSFLGDRPTEEASNRSTHSRSESFSIGTESAPGTLRRVKKPRPGSLKKKPLSRQNSNPESATSLTVSSSSTPEVKKKGKLAESPSPPQEEKKCPPSSPIPSPSPTGTLRRTRIKSRVESPPPVLEEISPAQAPVAAKVQEDVLPVPEEVSPIPPSATYKWDPDNFENIDPFSTGGSKIANSPVLGRKTDFIPAPDPSPILTEAPPAASAPPSDKTLSIVDQPITKRQPVRLEFDYSEESGDTLQDSPLPPKKLGKKQGAKMPLRKPKLGIKKAPPQTEQIDNTPAAVHLNDNDDIPIPKATYNFESSKWDDHNFNPFSSGKGIPNSPPQSRASYSFDPDSFDDSTDPFKSSTKMENSLPKAATFEVSSNDNENDNENVDELEDRNQNKPAKNKKKPLKS
ncbi:transforming acidic coiled-coil-containing protein 2 isoform X12 [Silurus asotus]|uniref:Transforming acidic coiled-coil-containing protein 2 isoform X12 n=1 Tax=Silurus asotus TaxID=30991 RepID=A0AAD5AHH3_SILAS|nr:transforming acidic coiled-coil-containing protein 2 isoform X12 [Silurus asotus]